MDNERKKPNDSLSAKESSPGKEVHERVIGTPLSRVDGHLKVTGKAQYAAEVKLPNLAYGVVVQSTIAKGRIKAIDTSMLSSISGITVFSYANRPTPLIKKGKKSELFLLEDPLIHYCGQIIALVIGNTLEQAAQAASLLKVQYEPSPANTETSNDPGKLIAPASDANSKRGDFASAWKSSSVKVSETYTTPCEVHNPMEPFATTAIWSGDSVLIHDSTQAVFATRDAVAESLNLPPNKVRIVAPFIGGGFGCKLSVWAHVPLTAMAARSLKRPVKLVLGRSQMFGPVGFRPSTIQKLSLAADQDGKLKAISHDVISETSTFAEFVETAAFNSRVTYACENVITSQRLERLDIGRPTWMRAPGHATGSFALECAMDELAIALAMDPIELRLRNFAHKDPDSSLPWSSNALRECFKQGAARFGWEKRDPQPRSMRNGELLLGMGMATALHSCWRNPASVVARLLPDGSALVETGTQDIGTGTYTIMTQIAAEYLSLPADKIKFRLGDTTMPASPMSGGSTTALSVGPVVAEAASGALQKLIDLAITDNQSPLFGLKKENILAHNGTLTAKNDAKKCESYGAIVSRTKSKKLEVRIDNKFADDESKYSMSTFGAQFAEVEIDPDLGTIRVARFVGAYGAGKILNPKTARSQMIGGITFGISMALMEKVLTDHNLHKIINGDLGEYHLPVHADINHIEPFFVEDHDSIVNKLGVKGIGEIGITGAAAAIANAVHHATGVRVRELPITLDKLLKA